MHTRAAISGRTIWLPLIGLGAFGMASLGAWVDDEQEIKIKIAPDGTLLGREVEDEGDDDDDDG